MKKFKKIVACGLALASVAGTYAEIAPHKEVLKADTTLEQMQNVAEFSVVGMPMEATVSNTPIVLPEGDGATITVKDFYGNAIDTVEAGFNSSTRELTIKKACDYIVTYTKSGVSKSFVIKVSGEVKELAFAQNQASFIPTEMFVNQIINLPEPTLEDGETFKIYVDDTEISKTGEKFVFGKTGDTDIEAGTHSIRYEATLKSGEVVSKTFNVTAVNTNAYGVEVGYTLSKTMPTTAEAGQDVSLPVFNTFNKKNGENKLENYTSVEVIYHKEDGTTENIDCNFVAAENSSEKDSFVFNAKYLATGTSYYEIKYTVNTVHSINGLTEPITETYQIRQVKDTKLEFKKLDLKATVLVHPTTGGSVTFTPELNEEFNANPDNITVTVKQGKNEVTVTNNNDGSYTFEALAGNRYTIVLSAEDEAGNTTTTDGFVVSAVSADEEAPEVEDIVCNKASANENEEVEFILPEADDTIATDLIYSVTVSGVTTLKYLRDGMDEKANVEASTKLQAGDKVYFNMPNAEAKIEVTVADSEEATANKTTKSYTVKVKDAAAPTLTVTATDAVGSVQQGETIIIPKVTVADANVFNTNLDFNLTIDGKDYSQTIVNTNNRTYTNATTMELNNVKFVASAAGDAVLTISAIDGDNNVAVKVYKFKVSSTANAVMNIGKVVSEVKVYEKVALPTPEFVNGSDNLVWTVVTVGEDTPDCRLYEEGGKQYFEAKAPGTFVVQYKVFNSSTFALETESVPYTITATDSTAPTFTLNAGENGLHIKSQEPFTSTQTTADIYLPGFKSVEDGGSSNYIKEYKLTVKDTNNKEYSVIFDNVAKTVKDADDVLTYEAAANRFKLVVNQIGTYTYKYEVTDLNGNTTTADVAKQVDGEMKLVVGDVKPPKMDDSQLTIKTSYKEGENFVADISDLVLSDAYDGDEVGTIKEELKNGKLKVALYKGSTTVDINVDKENCKITLKDAEALEVGDNYRLVLTFEDKAGNPAQITYNITVKAQEIEPVSHEKVWGIVLICVSVAVLGAVVVYFIATREKKAPVKEVKKENIAGDKPEQE